MDLRLFGSAWFMLGSFVMVEARSVDRPQDQFTPVRELISVRLDDKKIPSMAVAVAKGGEIVWEEGFGIADKVRDRKASPNTMYSLASISKPITATALMILKERGKIELERPINEYLGNAKVTARVGDAAQATVRRVADHTSGLPLHWHFFEEGKSKPPKRDETIRRYANLVTAPGEKYQYSNLGYGILDYVISRVSGTSYANFLDKEVFRPLGMKHASVGITKGMAKNAAPRCTSDRQPLPMYHFDHPGASEVYCSAHDLIRFAMFHLKDHLAGQKQILSDESLAAMQTPVTARGVGSSYGIGWAIGRGIRGYRRVEHSGGMPGVSTELLLFPNQDIAIAVLCNTSSSLVTEVTDKIVSILLPDYQAKRAAVLAQEQAMQDAAVNARSKPFQELSGEWNGEIKTYQASIPVRLLINGSGDVHVQLGSAPQAKISNPKRAGEIFTGDFQGSLGTDDTFKAVCDIELELRLRGDVLNGSVTAISRDGGSNGFGLSHWIELRKVK